MTPRFLLDTHVVVRWVIEPRKLAREQRRVVEAAAARQETVAISAVSLLEIAALEKSRRIDVEIRDIFAILQAQPVFQILPITFEIAFETSYLHTLRDPVDRAIVATALVHRLRLVTSDQRIVESKLVPVVE